MIRTVRSEHAPEAVGPYSHAVAGAGLLFVSGQLPLDPASGEMRDGSVSDQARQALANALAVVHDAGLETRNVAKVTVFLTDLRAYPLVNEVYAETFAGWCPARSVVEVSALPREASVEVELIAVADTDHG